LLSIMTAKKKITFIMNPISGVPKKNEIPAIIENRLDKEYFEYSTVFTEYPGHAAEMAKRAKDDGIDFVVAVGGDGTVNEVARAIIQSDTALGIIPCGSGNGLARHLMLPLDISKSIDIINQHNIHNLDYGVINDYPFFCTCGMGFDAFISMKFAEAGKRGPITYVENVLREGIKYQPETYRIEFDGGTITQKAFLVSCANASQYGNNAYIAPQASMSDGLLDLIIMEPFDMLDAPQIGIEMFNKTLDKNAKIRTLRTKHIHITREHDGAIHYDGDPIMTGTDIDVSIVNKGIKVIVNPKADKTRRRPNVVQTAFSDFLNDLSMLRTDINKQGRHIQQLNKTLLKKLNNL